MPKFMTIGYGDREGYNRTDAAVRDAAHAHDAWLRKAGALMGIAGTPVQVRNTDAKNIETKTGPFMSCSLPVAGFAVIEAATLADAVNLVSQTPCAVAHGVVEVWPLPWVVQGQPWQIATHWRGFEYRYEGPVHRRVSGRGTATG